jgi:putative transcriptional regulator
VIEVRLAELLNRHSKSRYWLAQNTPLTDATIRKLFRKKSKGIELATIDAICKAFDCQPSEFLVYVKNEEKEEIEQKNKSERAS